MPESEDGAGRRRSTAAAWIAFAATCAAAPWTAHGQAAAPAKDAAEPANAAPSPAAALPMRPLAEAIEVEAGATCLEREKLVGRVARWLERDAVDARIAVEVRGSASDPSAVKFVIHVGEGGRAERRIDDAPLDCDQLHSALALSIALAIDAALMDAEREKRQRDSLPSDEELFEPEVPAYFMLGLGLFGHATSGLLTDVAPGASVRIEIGFWPWLELRGGAFGSLIDGQRLPGLEGDFGVDLIAGRLDTCVSHGLRQLRLRLCAGGMAGSFRTHGRNFSGDSFEQAEPWVAVVGGFELQAEITRWLAIAVAVDAVVPLQARGIDARGPGDEVIAVRELSPLGVLVGVGPVFRFF